jgi:hypothetical protein
MAIYRARLQTAKHSPEMLFPLIKLGGLVELEFER